MDALSVHQLVALCGLGLGFVFGATVQRSDFCTMGAVSDLVLMGDARRLRAWLLVMAIAVLATQAMVLAGALDLDEAFYLSPRLGWFGAIVGGLMFGYGMTLAGGCGSRTLARLGTGNLKSLVVLLVLGLFAYITLRGLFALPRLELQAALDWNLAPLGLSSQGLPDLLAFAGLPGAPARGLAVAAVAGGLLWFCLKDRAFRRSPRHWLSGLIIGLVIPAGWWVNGVLAADDFEPVPLVSLTFVAPVGDTLFYLMLHTGTTVTFGIGTVGGVVAGAFASALLRRELRLEAFRDAPDMLRHLAGGALMGTGGVLALGCTVGQGMTGLSTLSIGSFLAVGGILAGAVLALRALEEGGLRALLRATGRRG